MNTSELVRLWHLNFKSHFFFSFGDILSGNFSPRLWSEPNLTEEMKNEEFQKSLDELDPYFRGLAELFADPSRMGKKGFIVNIDSTKIFSQISGDVTAQKDLHSLKDKVLLFFNQSNIILNS